MTNQSSIAVKNNSEVEKLVVPCAGFALREFRNEAELTIEQVAAAAKMEKSQVSRYETGDVSVNFRVLERLSKAIGVDPRKVIARCQAMLLEKVQERYAKTNLAEMVMNIRDHLDLDDC